MEELLAAQGGIGVDTHSTIRGRDAGHRGYRKQEQGPAGKDQRIGRTHTDQQPGSEARNGYGDSNAHGKAGAGQYQPLPEHQPEDVSRFCSERKTNTDLLSSLRN